MDRLGPRVRIRIRAFAAATPDLFVCRADIQSAIAVRIDEEEYIADVLRYLAEQRLAGAQTFFGLPFCRYIQVHDYGAIGTVTSQRSYHQ